VAQIFEQLTPVIAAVRRFIVAPLQLDRSVSGKLCRPLGVFTSVIRIHRLKPLRTGRRRILKRALFENGEVIENETAEGTQYNIILDRKIIITLYTLKIYYVI